jgi:Flp pilus assembly pilin Flp
MRASNSDAKSTIAGMKDDRGTVMVEYAILLSVVAVGCLLAVIGLGAPLVRMFIAQEVWLMMAVP